jgi:hypothetical protein
MSELQKIAEQAQKDARRASALRTAIQVVGDNADGALLRVEVNFVGNPPKYEAGEEVAKTIDRMWPTIWKETMEASASELKQIEARYASLMSEASINNGKPGFEDRWIPIDAMVPNEGSIVMGYGEYRERDGFSPAIMRWYGSINAWTVNSMPFYPTHYMELPAAPEGGA